MKCSYFDYSQSSLRNIPRVSFSSEWSPQIARIETIQARRQGGVRELLSVLPVSIERIPPHLPHECLRRIAQRDPSFIPAKRRRATHSSSVSHVL